MKENHRDTEQLILEAAKKVFVVKGFDGARMQEIADEANINKALLHYYYRSKDKLFEAVFKEVFKNFFPKVFGAIASDIPLKEKLVFVVSSYMELLRDNPYIPVFIVTEVMKKPQIFQELMGAVGFNPRIMMQVIKSEVFKVTGKEIKPEHFILNMLSMCAFPVIAKPIVKMILFENSEDAYELFLDERKEVIVNTIMKSIS